MRVMPDRLTEPIRIYRLARQGDDASRLFYDPFASEPDGYGGFASESQGFILAEGRAVAQEDRVSVHRSGPSIRIEATSFFNMYFIVRSLDRALPTDIDFGSPADADRVFLLRMQESPHFLYRHVIVHWHSFQYGAIQIYTTDAREGHRTSASLT